MLASVLYAVIVLSALVLLIQSIVSIQQTLYIWNDPDRMKASGVPDTFEQPELGFTVLLPARHEAAVIGETLRKLGAAHYPKDKVELMVICSEDDLETIAAAEAAKFEHKLINVTVLVFDGAPGKSKAMNLGLAAAKHPIVTIFDSEDDVSQDIFTIVNTIYLRRNVDVLQCGVQLMDYNSHWFSAHNVLEYFFWFKSRMHYYAKLQAVPLGGNTVFFRADDLKEVDGWDEVGLTEDADIGIRLSLKGKVFDVMYDPRHVTREEVPHTTKAFVKQRTRWNQGFLQILRKGDWLKLPRPEQKLLVGYVLTAPTYMALVIASAPLLVLLGATTKLPVAVSLFTFVPLFLAVVMLMVSLLGLHEFGKDQKIKVKPWSYAFLAITFIPYQVLLLVSSVRAMIREARGNRGWEKTVHLGGHRTAEHAQPVFAPVGIAASEVA
ncbi:glycosyltransferase [Marisediminicola senii]|uniref:glycosyltransferase n=1 Tax=Marisediminicola senii TaxID=2711233 RepID=UPI0013EE04A2|nr:glycosyltransferase [Marisediminicola senii]